MRTLIHSLFFWVTITASFAQVNKASLTDDPLFSRIVAKDIRFNRAAQQLGKSVKVFVGFTLTEQGSYQDISVVNSGFVAQPFKEEINRLWSRLPKQDPRYAGRYVLPVTFLLGKGGPHQLHEITNKNDTIIKADSYELLGEVSVTGYLACENKALTQEPN